MRKTKKEVIEREIIILIGIAILALCYTMFVGNITGKVTENTLNLEVEIPKDYGNIKPGEKLWFTTRILNLANKERVDIILTYDITDKNDYTIATRSETVAIETQASFVGEIKIPEDATDGTYILHVTMTQASGEKSKSQTSFNIYKEQTALSIILTYKTWIITGAIIVLIFIIFISFKSKLGGSLKKRKIKSQIQSMIQKKAQARIT